MAKGDGEGREGGGGVRGRGGCIADVLAIDRSIVGDGLHYPADAVDGDSATAEGRGRLQGNWFVGPDLEGRGGRHG